MSEESTWVLLPHPYLFFVYHGVFDKDPRKKVSVRPDIASDLSMRQQSYRTACDVSELNTPTRKPGQIFS